MQKEDPKETSQMENISTNYAITETDNESKPVKKKSRKIRLMVVFALIIILFRAPISYAILGDVVFDPTVKKTLDTIAIVAEKSKERHFISTVVWIQNQYYQLIKQQQYWEQIHGSWKEPLTFTKVAQITLSSYGVDIKDLGWDKNPFGGKDAKGKLQLAATAIEDLQRITEGKAEKNAMKNLRTDLENVYGITPNTENGAAIESAYKTMSKSISFNGEANKAIKEMNENIDRNLADAQSGKLAPGDIERRMLVQQSLAIKSQMQQQQTTIQTNELLREIVGSQTKSNVSKEQARLREIARRKEIVAGVMFSPALQTGKGVE